MCTVCWVLSRANLFGVAAASPIDVVRGGWWWHLRWGLAVPVAGSGVGRLRCWPAPVRPPFLPTARRAAGWPHLCGRPAPPTRAAPPPAAAATSPPPLADAPLPNAAGGPRLPPAGSPTPRAAAGGTGRHPTRRLGTQSCPWRASPAQPRIPLCGRTTPCGTGEVMSSALSTRCVLPADGTRSRPSHRRQCAVHRRPGGGAAAAAVPPPPRLGRLPWLA